MNPLSFTFGLCLGFAVACLVERLVWWHERRHGFTVSPEVLAEARRIRAATAQQAARLEGFRR